MEDRKKRHTAIVLAAGKGSRMQSDTPKQYLPLGGKPVLYYSLKAFEDSFVDDIILVTGLDEKEYCQTEIVQKYGISKVKRIIHGGGERYQSVYRGLLAAGHTDYVYIHDGARPFLTADILRRARRTVEAFDACVAAMPVKDTIKIATVDRFVAETPERSRVWQIQTPQAFSYDLVLGAYKDMRTGRLGARPTDDAMVVERMRRWPIKLFEGSYQNIKITTPEDLVLAEALLRRSSS